MTDQPLDPNAIMAAHAELHRCVGGDFVSSRRAKYMDPECEPYRLAAALAAAQEREQRVRELHTEGDGGICWTCGEDFPCPTRAALADGGAADQPG